MSKALEDLQAGRDPFAVTQEETKSPSAFYYNAAKACAWLPIIAGILAFGISHATAGQTGLVTLIMRLGTGGLCCLMAVTGIIFGIIALCGMSTHGSEGILWRSVRGMISSLLFIGIFTSGVVHGFQDAMQNRKAMAELKSDSHELQVQLKNDAQEAKPATPEKSNELLAQYQGALIKAAKNANGDAALILKATSGYASKMQLAMKDYTAGLTGLREPPILDMAAVDKREQILARKETAKRFLTANEKLEAFLVNSEEILRKELKEAKVPQDTIEAVIDGQHQATRQKMQTIVRVRQTDRQIGNSMIGMLDVLDVNWGKWHYDSDRKKVIFDSDATLDKYITYRDAMESAAREQTRLQAQVLNVANNQ